MKLQKFRVKNYKSISDTGYCFLADRVTILAGKNEAGKSSLLEALQDFNLDREIRADALPIERADAKPAVELVFILSASEIKEICAATTLRAPKGLHDEVAITINKVYPNKYEVSAPEFGDWIAIDRNKTEAEARTSYQTFVREKLAPHVSEEQKVLLALPLSDDTSSIAKLNEMEAGFGAVINALSDEDRGVVADAISELRDALEYRQVAATWEDLVLSEMKNRLPNFVLFSSFDDVFPNQIAIADLDANPWIADLRMMSNINIDVIKSGTSQQKITHRKALNVAFDKNYRAFWTQDLSHIEIEWDNQSVNFWIEENGYYYPPAIRSQGKRWHLAFYIRVSSRSRPGVRNIILIDEPGLFLHAKAQRDILAQLEENSQNVNVLFSTHSPYLIEADKLDRIRLVLKSEMRGTYVENKIHAVSDTETLTPILTAIGLELNQGIVAADRRKNVIVEGPSDYFYLTALAILTNCNEFKFISGGGAGNMPKVGTILQGWGCQVIYLYDHDNAFKQAQKNIRREWLTIVSEMLAKIPVTGPIENLFTVQDFATAVLSVAAISGTPASYMSSNNLDKVLPAKLLLERARGVTPPNLSQTTLTNFRNLFSQLEAAFKAVYP